MTIEEIRAELDESADAYAIGAAAFEPVGVGGLTMFDIQRKRLLSQIGATLLADGVKRTEKVIDIETHAHAKYVAFIDRGLEHLVLYRRLAGRRAALLGQLAIAEMRETHNSIL